GMAQVMAATTTRAARIRDGTLRTSAGMRGVLSRFWQKSYKDGLTGLAGMVAYNLLLSLLPLTLLALFVFGQIIQSPEVEASIIRDVQRVLPTTSEGAITRLLSEISRSSTSIGIAALLSSIWIGASFWGAMDTAFCKIYCSPCRSWLKQKRFALAMLAVVLVLFAATVAVPATQSLVAHSADDLPFGLSASTAVYVFTLIASVVILFGTLSLIYKVVPNTRVPWRAIWPGALGATIAIGIVDYAFPLYLQVSVLTTFGGTYVFVLIILVWFYVVAIILLAGAVINALRLGLTEEASPAPS
ncbi:MAG: YihY/virulence factor BrkB family protein, partial [Solirubrobacteraceae bacterium]